MAIRRFAICIPILLAVCTAQESVPPSKLPVWLRCKCDDPVASLVATSIRDEVSVSTRYRLSSESDAQFIIAIIGRKIEPMEPPSSALSLVFVRASGHRLLGHEILLCSASKTKWCAQMALSDFDDAVANSH